MEDYKGSWQTYWHTGPDVYEGYGLVFHDCTREEAIKQAKELPNQPDDGWAIPGIYWEAKEVE